MKKTRFGKRRQQKTDMALQITSMADIFTIILVFLLKSYSSGAVGLSPSQGVSLPQAKGGKEAVDALKLEVSSTFVQVEGKTATILNNFNFSQTDLEPSGASQSLLKALGSERGRQLASATKKGDGKPDPRIMVMVDQRTPYSTLKTVLASAAQHGYSDFKLVVIKEE